MRACTYPGLWGRRPNWEGEVHREQNRNETDRQKQDTFPCTGKHGSLREAVGMNARNKSKFRDGPVR